MTRRRQGFSLVEATVAVAVLALGCVAVTAVLQGSLGAEAGLAARRVAGDALDTESARLRALTYFLPSSGPGLGPPSLLSELFPHARPWLDTSDAAYVTDTGAFITQGVAGGLRLMRTARFARLSADRLEPLLPGDVHGWAVWDDVRPPAIVLSVRIQATGPNGLVTSRDLVVYALRPGTRFAFGERGGHDRVC